MINVVFFLFFFEQMGKFYELFEMDAHVGARELDLQYMKVTTCFEGTKYNFIPWWRGNVCV